MRLVKDILDILDRNDDWKQMKQSAKEIEQLKQRVAVLEQKLEGKHAALICEHCASTDLTRKGNRPSPIFGELGMKEAIYQCNDCHKETYQELPLR